MRSKVQPIEKKEDVVLTTALLRAADHFALDRLELAAILGVSEASLSRLYHQTRFIDSLSKEGELAVLFVRIFFDLTSLLGGNYSSCQQWLRNRNDHLNGIPIELAKNIQGLMMIVSYLEFMREKV
jgi:hypothetical protein